MDLTTRYLGLHLEHPFIAGASPFGRLEFVRHFEDAGCAAIVLGSLFEEQITFASTGRIRHMDPLDDRGFAGKLASFPRRFRFGPDDYLEQIRLAKRAVDIPVIASLNGTSAEAWLTFAGRIEQAGADAIELNLFEVLTDPSVSALSVERELSHVVSELEEDLAIPVAVKLSPFFTATGNVARRLDLAGADGLVLFNRYYEPDIDVETMSLEPHLELSTSAELRLRLRWLGLLYGRVRASLAAAGGVAEPEDGIKAILAGADAVQMVSAILRNGPEHFGTMRDGLASWMDRHAFASLDAVRGKLSLAEVEDASALERANYLKTLQEWPDEAEALKN